MTLVIAGSRHLTGHAPTIERFLDSSPHVSLILHGGAQGVDASAHDVATKRGIPVEIVPAEWERHGKAAGPLRNREMARRADTLLLIWDGRSRGSASMKREAESRGVEVHEMIAGEGDE